MFSQDFEQHRYASLAIVTILTNSIIIITMMICTVRRFCSFIVVIITITIINIIIKIIIIIIIIMIVMTMIMHTGGTCPQAQ